MTHFYPIFNSVRYDSRVFAASAPYPSPRASCLVPLERGRRDGALGLYLVQIDQLGAELFTISYRRRKSLTRKPRFRYNSATAQPNT